MWSPARYVTCALRIPLRLQSGGQQEKGYDNYGDDDDDDDDDGDEDDDDDCDECP